VKSALCLSPGDTLLLGADLVKPISQVLPAYDDPIGVTAAFNLNLLARINRELGADFDLRHFRHEARYNEASAAIEMHLRSEVEQTVRIPRRISSSRCGAARPSGPSPATNSDWPRIRGDWGVTPASSACSSGRIRTGLSPRVCSPWDSP
jgi:hypothetical protein